MLQIRRADPKDFESILRLAVSVNEESVIPLLSEEGQHTMRAARESDVMSALENLQFKALVALLEDRIIGYVTFRDDYIAQMYVDNANQQRGVGTKLLMAVLTSTTKPAIKLKASVNATGFYARNGFVAQGSEQAINGIRFVPMIYVRPEK